MGQNPCARPRWREQVIGLARSALGQPHFRELVQSFDLQHEIPFNRAQQTLVLCPGLIAESAERRGTQGRRRAAVRVHHQCSRSSATGCGLQNHPPNRNVTAALITMRDKAPTTGLGVVGLIPRVDCGRQIIRVHRRLCIPDRRRSSRTLTPSRSFSRGLETCRRSKNASTPTTDASFAMRITWHDSTAPPHIHGRASGRRPLRATLGVRCCCIEAGRTDRRSFRPWRGGGGGAARRGGLVHLCVRRFPSDQESRLRSSREGYTEDRRPTP